MLTSGVFLPRCTEFIVEYSLGLTNAPTPEKRTSLGRRVLAQPQRYGAAPQGVIWHGLQRIVPEDPSVDPATVTLNTPSLAVTVPYTQYFQLFGQGLEAFQFQDINRPERGFDTTSPLSGYYYSVPVTTRDGRSLELPHPVLPSSIENSQDFFGNGETPPRQMVLNAAFGYYDPTWVPEIGQRRLRGYDVRLADGTTKTYASQELFDGDDDAQGINRRTWFDPTCVVNNPVIYNVLGGNRREDTVTYDPDRGDIRAWELVKDVNGDGLYNPQQGDEVRFNLPTTMPAVWPKLVRVTYSIADPSDPTFEQTFQIVLEVPPGTQLPTY